ncbi:MAG: hypothetical protein ABFD86_00720 [Bryobacteraceae bacterium]
MAAFLALTAKPLLWHFEYFKSPGPQFYKLLMVGLPVSAVAVAVYTQVRRRALWRHGPVILAGVLAAAALAYEPTATLVSVSMLAAAYAAGSTLRKRLGLEAGDPAGDIAVAATAGFALFSWVLFWVGLAHLFYPATFALLIATPFILWRREIPMLARACRRIWQNWSSDDELSRPLAGVLMTFGAVLAVSSAMVVLSPSVAFDPLKMHLTLAATFARQHSLEPLAFLDYSYFPQGAEVLMAAAYSLAGQAGAQMLPAVFFALLLLLLVSILRRVGMDRLETLAGMTAVVSMPFLHWTGSVAKNDAALALYQLAAVDAYLRWRKSGRFRWIWLGTFLLAASFGVKHVALMGGAAIGLLYLHAVWSERRRLRALAAVALIFGAFGLCWHVRAWWLTGNPVYPERVSSSVSLQTRALPPQRKFARPWRLLYHGKAFFESPLEYPMGAVLLLSLPAWLMIRRRKSSSGERACLVFITITLAYWICHIPGLRYAVAPLALLAALTAARLPTLARSYGRWTSASVTGALAYALLFGVCGALIVEVNRPQLSYFRRHLDKAGYLREALRTYGSIEFVRGTAQPGERVFGVGNCSYAYAPEPAKMRCYMNRNGVYREADAETVRTQLVLGEFRYLIVPQGEPGHAILRAAGPSLEPAPAYQDTYFAVYRVPLSPLGVSHSQQSLQR